MNKKQLIALSLVAVFFLVTNYAFAEAIEIKPKEVSGWENFTPRVLKIMQKEYVDEGHQPWRSDPVSYAKLFMKAYYPKLDVNKMETVPAKLTLKGNDALVEITYHKKRHAIYLHKVFPHNPESIWIVDKMNIR